MIPVVLSGGVGTRLWPLSRSNFPKQFCELLDESLLQKTLKRVKKLGSPWTVTVEDLRHLTGRVYSDLDIKGEQILIEPQGRNTAPAIALLCAQLKAMGLDNEVVGVFPADHLILKEEVFIEAAQLAEESALKKQVVTLGLKPSYPATGFGYIEVEKESLGTRGDLSAQKTKGFHEKPEKSTAEKFVASGQHYWNAGIFFFQVSHMIQLFSEFLPETWSKLESCDLKSDELKSIYSSLEKISIDHGIMEKTKDQVCIPCDLGWSDLGSWDDVAQLYQSKEQMGLANNALAIERDSFNNFVFSPAQKIIGLVGIEDLMVVDMPDALLISKKGQSQKVKELVEDIKSQNLPQAHEHVFDVRPWGKFAILSDDTHYKTKYITVEPGHQLSYQRHEKRSEHWIVISGKGQLVLDDEVQTISAGQSVTIPQGTKHRIKNIGSELLEFVEVQTGTYFGEDDIERFEDDYNRS